MHQCLFLFELIEMDLTITEPVQKPLKGFHSPEFNIYCHKRKDDIDGQTIHMLNRKYKVTGYKLTKVKGVLCLKKEGKNYYKAKLNEMNDEHDMKSLVDRMNGLEDKLNEIIDYINSNSLGQK